MLASPVFDYLYDKFSQVTTIIVKNEQFKIPFLWQFRENFKLAWVLNQRVSINCIKVAGNNRKFTTSESVVPAYARPGFSWLRLIAPGNGPSSGI